MASGHGDPLKKSPPRPSRARLDPFALGAAIDRRLDQLFRIINRRQSPRTLTKVGRAMIRDIQEIFGVAVVVGKGLKGAAPSVTGNMARRSGPR
jgi:hypothetical protein